ncbi:hypothetical protein MKUB_27500 [Mycobacterium kubicae]|uniref:PecA family PE domain-processing aspartic protease n=1 Tax=Mycobacterium kubicae TaxID=120959 RepID=A0AAX1J5N7_9MYCO|nr:PecA family PE domain-processing aspartic protease [Mycobacterium kubicae]MCV7096116.1 PecA family PE domain-processing aspartic protease [Mycobacterium kubicae]ORV99211.1 hypothetical protein AWC13_10660 [Mycobacterium kubicae]QNI12269.1 PE family protein [Mycobacterium kubicae]QPI35786.1 PecA family PE domain-processing aspartic protease [Mycobacterium kubicae]GFG65260.1 hypothetical protein MKUB_27500 [Mycobacterium kubicae]
MSLVLVDTGWLSAAAADLENLGSALTSANAAAAAPTTGLVAAAADEVSTAIASLFGGFGQEYQALSSQLSAYHLQFVRNLGAAVGSYQGTEAASVSILDTLQQDVLGVINAPTQLFLGRPLIGDGAAGTAANPNGGAGGLLFGNGGNGYSPTNGNAGGGAGGPAGFFGNGGVGGNGFGTGAGGPGGTAGWLYGWGGPGGTGGASGGAGGAGGAAPGLIGWGGNGGAGGLGAGANVPGGRAYGGPGGASGLLFGNTGHSGLGWDGRTVSMGVNAGTEPYVNISVNGGPNLPVLVDTGSEGLVVTPNAIGGLPGLLKLGLPVSFGMSGYSGGLTYLFATYNAPVDFGNGIVTAPTPVDVVLFAFPQTLEGYFAPAGVTGVLGLGPNAVGPGPSSPVVGLGGNLNQGVLIDQPQGHLQFGPQTLPGTSHSTIGAPISPVQVSINNEPWQQTTAILDSGGVTGTLPASLLPAGGLPPNATISVYNMKGDLLYEYHTNASTGYTPVITTGNTMNSGNYPFRYQPVFIDYSPNGTGTTVFYDP